MEDEEEVKEEVKYTLQDLKHAYRAGVFDSQMDSHIADDIDSAFDDYLENLNKSNEVKEKTIKIPYSWIKYNCGWSKYCDITGSNHYAIKEYGEPDEDEYYEVTLTEAKQLGYIRNEY